MAKSDFDVSYTSMFYHLERDCIVLKTLSPQAYEDLAHAQILVSQPKPEGCFLAGRLYSNCPVIQPLKENQQYQKVILIMSSVVTISGSTFHSRQASMRRGANLETGSEVLNWDSASNRTL